MFQKKIEFSSPQPDWLVPPKPAKKCIPEWFKNIGNHFGNFKNYENPTVKKCVPVLDSLTSGYLILNPVEVVFYQEKEELKWTYKEEIYDELPSLNLGITTHNLGQVSKDIIDPSEYQAVFKYSNPWKIKTPKNYSCLFTNPLNTEGKNIRLISGIVDTDEYKLNINFPFLLKKMKEGETFVLRKNEPIALVFPFLRDSWKMEIKKEKNIEKNTEAAFKLFSYIEDGYKKCVWKRKNYD